MKFLREMATTVFCALLIVLGVETAKTCSGVLSFYTALVVLITSTFLINSIFYLHDKGRDKKLLKKLLQFAQKSVVEASDYIAKTGKKLVFRVSISYIDLVNTETEHILNSWPLPGLDILKERDDVITEPSRVELSHLILSYVENFGEKEVEGKPVEGEEIE